MQPFVHTHFVSGFEERGKLGQSYVHRKILLQKDSIIHFKVVKTEILGLSYGCLMFTKCIDIRK